MIRLIDARSEEQLENIRELFKEYAESLGFDLAFQDFAGEVRSLPGDYEPPDGSLVLALLNNDIAGCAAMRKVEEGICEMKRMYVRREFRRKGIGREMARRIIELARSVGYKKMRLDTIDTMTEAIALYESLGFRTIKPYRYNPIKGARFMEMSL